jgi:hypothetical protein
LYAILKFNFNIAYNKEKTKKIYTCEIGVASGSQLSVSPPIMQRLQHEYPFVTILPFPM